MRVVDGISVEYYFVVGVDVVGLIVVLVFYVDGLVVVDDYLGSSGVGKYMEVFMVYCGF